MELKIERIAIPEEHEYTVDDLCNFSTPIFIFGDLIALKSKGKLGCINRKNGKVEIPFKYDEISVSPSKNQIEMAIVIDTNGNKKFEFYDYVCDYYDKKYMSIHFPDKFEDFETFEAFKSRVLKKFDNHHLTEGKSPFDAPEWVVIRGNIYYSDGGCLRVFDLYQGAPVGIFEQWIEDPEENKWFSDKNILDYKERIKDYHLIFEKDHLVAVNRNMIAIEFQFGRAKRRKFFASEKEMENYLAKFEESFLDNILKF